MDKQARREPTVGSVWEAGPWRAEVKGEAISSQWPCKVWLNGAQQADGMVSLDWFHEIARYVRGPEAAEPAPVFDAIALKRAMVDKQPPGSVEVTPGVYLSAEPVPWKVGQRRRGAVADMGGKFGKLLREFVVEEAYGPNSFDYQWLVRQTCNTDNDRGDAWGFCESWPSELFQDAPKATPMTRPCCGLAASDCECPKAMPMDELQKHITNVRPAVIAKPRCTCVNCEAGANPCVSLRGTAREAREVPKPHRFDRYCVAFGMEACVDCGAVTGGFTTTMACAPVPGWREKYERDRAEEMAHRDARRLPAPEMTRYDARQLLAPVGLGPDVLCCPVRSIRGLR